MGTGAASEMLLLGTKIDAQKALKHNLLTEVFPDATFREQAWKKVEAFAKLPPKVNHNNVTTYSICQSSYYSQCPSFVERLLSVN